MTVGTTTRSAWRPAWRWGWQALAGVPLLFLMLILTYFSWFYFLGTLVLCAAAVRVRLWLLAAVALVGLPLTSAGVQGARYFRGTATFQTMGLPGITTFNPDRTYRCQWSTGGCLVNGNEWITQDPANLTLRTLVWLFGPMRGSYTGPYPTEDESLAAITSDSAVTLPADSISSDKIDVGGTSVRLDAGIGKRLLETFGRYDPLDGHFELKAALWQSSVLLIGLPPDPKVEEGHAGVVAIDVNAGRPFAYYGTTWQRFPPVWWSKSQDDLWHPH